MTSAGELASIVTFSPPSAPPGIYQAFVKYADKQSLPTIISLVAVPSTPPLLRSITPQSGPNTGGLGVSRPSAAPIVTIVLTNLERVTSPSSIQIVGQLSSMSVSLAGSEKGVTVVSSITETSISFPLPSFPSSGGGEGRFTIYASGRELLNATAKFTFFDATLASLVAAFPTSARADTVLTSQLTISRFGVPIAGAPFAFPADAASTTAAVTSSALQPDGSTMVLTVQVSRAAGAPPAVVRVTVQNCASGQACPAKTVSFDATFRDPAAPYVRSFSPAYTFSDGGVPITIEVQGFPLSLNASSVALYLGSAGYAHSVTVAFPPGQATVSILGVTDATITATMPAVSGNLSIVPSVVLAGVSAPFPSQLVVLVPPSPRVVSASPSYADLATETPIVLGLSMFPGVFSTADIVVIFRWRDGARARGKVTSYTRDVPTMPATEVQDAKVYVSSPVGGSVKEGVVELIVYNVRQAERTAVYQGFFIVDSALPVVSGLSTDEAKTGRQSVLIRSSQPTQVTLFATNAKASIADITVGGVASDLLLSQYSQAQKTVKALITAPAKTTSASSLTGMVRFSGASCGSSCLVSCCAAGNCGAQCLCQTACFTLSYYDDLAPTITYLSVSQGPDVGGTEVLATVHRFPIVRDASEVTVSVDAGAAFAEVHVVSSGSASSTLRLFSPSVDMKGLAFRQVTRPTPADPDPMPQARRPLPQPCNNNSKHYYHNPGITSLNITT